jgi:hypothetical protein
MFGLDFKPSSKNNDIFYPLVLVEFFMVQFPCRHGMCGFGRNWAGEAIDNS